MKWPTTRRALSRTAVLLALSATVACGEGSPLSGRAPALAPASHPITTVARLRGTLDVASGTLTFDPVSSTGASIPASGVSASIYGEQGVTVRIYNSAVVTGAPVGGKKTYTANVGVRNLLGYRIGDEQNVTAPADTMGIYVFVNTAPITVSGTSSPCACAVTVKNATGSRIFTSLANQPYWFWPELLGPANGGADTTLLRKQWVFEADTQVTRFNFDILVSAAWSAPNESVWKVQYSADSLPDTQAEPRWRKFATSKVTSVIAANTLQLDLQRSKDSIMYVRRDSISSGVNALMEATFRLDSGGGSTAPQAGIAIDDKNRYVALFVTDTSGTTPASVGFLAPGGGFVAGASDIVTVHAMHTYRVQKYAADSVVAFVDGVRRFKAAYNQLPLTRAAGGLPSSFAFGIAQTSSRNTTTSWSSVLYQIGQATP
jgi:hypothetical protein